MRSFIVIVGHAHHQSQLVSSFCFLTQQPCLSQRLGEVETLCHKLCYMWKDMVYLHPPKVGKTMIQHGFSVFSVNIYEYSCIVVLVYKTVI